LAEGDAADGNGFVPRIVVALANAGEELFELNPVEPPDRADLAGRDEEMLLRIGRLAEDEPLTADVSKLL
jgi:hypothetical protein